MIEGLVENLDFLHFNSNNAKRLIQAIANICFAFFLYDLLGGSIIFPKEISTKTVFDFFYSFQIIIPIILYLLVWVVFYWIVKVLIFGFVERFLIVFYKYRFQNKNIDKLLEEYSGGTLSIDPNIEKSSEEKRDIFISEWSKKISLKIEENLNSFIVISQITTIYIFKLRPTIPFYEWGNTVVLFTLISGLLLTIYRVNRIIKSKVFMFLYQQSNL
ncbi:MAG: hypothetical protein MUF45_00075 [Spirosomaceae bacterium]|jgi:hypothetical protein|nr:hypothetical protein [Spirosomataceae bacterium]